jgi:hypothetical protein
MQDHNPHFMSGTPFIFIQMDTFNEQGAICYCEGANLIRQYVNVEYLHRQDTFTLNHMFAPFYVFPINQNFWGTDDTLSQKYFNLCGQLSRNH